jgi:hemerythrin-like domain-containing protein
MNKTKPIKRNPALVNLSKDHHFALLLIWKIKEGLKKPVQPERITQYVLHFFDTDLKQHFQNEENLLNKELDAKDEMRRRTEEEHKEIREMIERLRKKGDDTLLLEQFASALEAHIRFEERELFNMLQEKLGQVWLDKIERSIPVIQHEEESAWADTFWK